MGPEAIVKANSSWYLTLDTKSATLWLNEWPKERTEAPTASFLLRLARRVPCSSMKMTEEGGRKASREKLNHGVLMGLNPTWLQTRQPGGFDENDMPSEYFPVNWFLYKIYRRPGPFCVQ